ncbi:MAG TPA: hypothetical protein VIT42_07810 [Microlunatus sp.]
MAGKPDPTRMLSAALYGTARKLAVDGGSIRDAQQIIHDLAAGRIDLIAQEAGLAAGDWFASIHTKQPIELLTAGLLIVSGPVDFELVARWVEIGRKRAAAPMYQAR